MTDHAQVIRAALAAAPFPTGRAVEALNALTDALEVYADARHWAISRYEFRHPSCVWIGPGSEDKVPNGPGVARAALSPAAAPDRAEPSEHRGARR